MVASATEIELATLLGLDEPAKSRGDRPRKKVPVRFRRRYRQQKTIAITAKATMPMTTPRMIASRLSSLACESLDDAADVDFGVDDPPSVVAVAVEAVVDVAGFTELVDVAELEL